MLVALSMNCGKISFNKTAETYEDDKATHLW